MVAKPFSQDASNGDVCGGAAIFLSWQRGWSCCCFFFFFKVSVIEVRSSSVVAPKYFILLTFFTAVSIISSGICLPEINNNLTALV